MSRNSLLLVRVLLILALTGIVSAKLASAGIESPHGKLTFDCQTCHTTDNWLNMKTDSGFSHDVMTDYPLVGRHKGVRCIECHATLVFSDASTTCYECHTDVHRGQFTDNCSQCHSPHQWVDETNFRKMHESTRFPLVGMHATLDCQSCHANGQYVNLVTECIGCHTEQFTATTSPNHTDAGFSRNCTECHSVTAVDWKGPQFAHTQEFLLTGGHALNDCQRCHTGGYVNTPSACVECHQNDYAAATNPTHEGAAFPSTCEACHTTNSWRPASFENHSNTAFPLTGAHVLTDCAQCHIGGQYAGTTTQCVGCHHADYDGATNPQHDATAFGTTCQQCHVTDAWRPATFDNHSLTIFPLTGAHVQTNCLECHIGGVYDGTPTDCWSCHQDDYSGTTDPNHVASGFPQNCTVCHSTENWTEATFDHNLTIFPLTGAHVQTNCLECHIGGVYDGTPTDCWSCHQDDYNEQSDHVQNGFPHDCALCHNTTDWDETTFNHSNTAFPLTGAHVQTNCLECHIGGVYDGTPTDCWSCHEDDYNVAEDHLENNFPHDCALCHNTTDWDETTFNHNNTDFPLTGAHTSTGCIQCHTNGQYANTPADCWFCHQTDFNSASPDHNDGYPQECLDCHTTSNWNSSFNHDSQHFPIYSGRHNGEWNSCNECHTINGNYSAFNCIECHEHSDQGDVDDDHDDVGGYTYTPTSCYACHPTGNGDDRGAPDPDRKRVKPNRTGVQN